MQQKINIPAYIEVQEDEFCRVDVVLKDKALRAAGLAIAKRRSEHERAVIRLLTNPRLWALVPEQVMSDELLFD